MAIFSLILIIRKLKVKLIKVKTAKFVRRGQHLYVPCCTLVFLFFHFDSMTMMIWPHPPHIALYIFLWRSNRTTQGDDKDTSTDECDGADDLFTDASSICGRPHRGRLRFAGFRLPTCQAFTFWGVSNVSNGQTKTQICLEPHPGGVGDISARLMIVNVKNSDYMR